MANLIPRVTFLRKHLVKNRLENGFTMGILNYEYSGNSEQTLEAVKYNHRNSNGRCESIDCHRAVWPCRIHDIASGAADDEVYAVARARVDFQKQRDDAVEHLFALMEDHSAGDPVVQEALRAAKVADMNLKAWPLF